MFVCYLDDSDNALGPVMTIAGYYTSLDSWAKFEPVADNFLNSYGVEVLRGKDFRSGHKSFKNWPLRKKLQFVDELYFLAKEYLVEGVCSSAQKKEWLQIKAHYSGYQNMSPLGLCFATVISGILTKSMVWPQIFASKLSFIVEEGNKNNGNLVNYFNYLKKSDDKLRNVLGSITFVGKRDCRAIQIADFLAFHGRLVCERWEKEGYTLEWGRKGGVEETILRYVRHRFNRAHGNIIVEGTIDDSMLEATNFMFAHDPRFGKGTG